MTQLLGAFFNAVGIVAGGVIGILWGTRLPPGYQAQATRILGLIVLLIGLKMAWPFTDPINTLLSLIVGGWLGAGAHLDRALDRLGRHFEKTVGRSGFMTGFITASLLFNVGAMAILGSFQAGMEHRGSILATKAVLDGVTAILLAGISGWGVIGSAAVTFLYEGGLTLLAGQLGEVLHGALLIDFTVAGGVIIAGMGVNFLTDHNVLNVPNLLPALAVSVALGWLKHLGFTFL